MLQQSMVGPWSPKQVHRGAVMRLIRLSQQTSRLAVARALGLNPSTVSRIVDELIRAGVLQVTGSEVKNETGRRSDLISLDPNGGRIIAIHPGPVGSDVGIADLSGRVYAERHLPAGPTGNAEETLTPILDAVDRLLAGDRNAAPVVGVGVEIGGEINRAAGTVESHVYLEWKHVPLRDLIRRRLGCHVALVNAFQGRAWAESMFAADARGRTVLFVGVGDYIGAGLSSDRYLQFDVESTIGQLGHTRLGESRTLCACGKRGCLNTTVSTDALAARAAETIAAMRGEGRTAPGSIARLGELAASGDRAAVALFDERALVLAPAVAVLANTFGPDLLVFGQAEHPYLQQELHALAQHILAELYPPLAERITIRLSNTESHQHGMQSAVAALLQDFCSPALSLRHGRDGRLIPVLRATTDQAEA